MPHSRESWKPSSAGCIDRCFCFAQMFNMILKNAISEALKVLACLGLSLALVFFPPSASHAASDVHGDHLAASENPDHGDAGHAYGAGSSNSMHGKCGSVSQTDDAEQASGQCCSGICLSVVLSEIGSVFVDQITSDKYLTLHARKNSTEPSGFLRPPQHLI